MRLLHTADWHLNDRLHRMDRTEHLRRRVEKVAEICESEKVDVLLIAGDLFSDQATQTQVAASFRHLRETFAEFLGRGGVAIAVTGNHDQDGRVHSQLEIARAGMELANPKMLRGDRFRPGKAYLVDTGFVGRVWDEREKFDVQFVLVPFPSSSRLLNGDEAAATSGEINRANQGELSGWMRSVTDLSGYDRTLHTVMMAHLHVKGADVGRGLFRITEEQDILLEETDLPSEFAYVALGHIHKPQLIRGQKHVRYAGSLDRLDYGERNDDKSVVLIDIGPRGRVGDPVAVPIEATRMVIVPLSEATLDVEAISQIVPNPVDTLVRLEIDAEAVLDADAIERAARNLLPNVTWVEKPRMKFADSATDRVVVHGPNVRETILEYLRQRLPAEGNLREDVLTLASTFFERGDSR